MHHRPRGISIHWAAAAILAVTALAACATLGSHASRPDPTLRLARGLQALDSANYRAAYRDLSWVYTRFPEQPVGRHALQALGAAALDPRNPDRRLDVGARIIGGVLTTGRVPDWERPILESLYLMGVELGARDYNVARARQRADSALSAARADTSLAAADSALARLLRPGPTIVRPDSMPRPGAPHRRGLPRLPVPTVTARLEVLREQRDALQTQNDQLTRRIESLESQLTDARKELKRVRKALHG